MAAAIYSPLDLYKSPEKILKNPFFKSTFFLDVCKYMIPVYKYTNSDN